MRTLTALVWIWVACMPVQGAATDTQLTSAQLGTLERHSPDGKKAFGTFQDMMNEFQFRVTTCVQGFKPKASGAGAQADSKSFQECLKRQFNENVLEPLSRRMYPNEQLSSCK